MHRMMISSITAVRTIMAQAICLPRGHSPHDGLARSPASRRANGSRKIASGRSVSMARYTATQRAVSETWPISLSSVMSGTG